MILDDLIEKLEEAITEGKKVMGNPSATKPQHDYAEHLIRLLEQQIKDGKAINS